MKDMQIELKQTFTSSTHQASQFSTNRVLVQENGNSTIYYLPCYVNFKVKEITSLDITGLKATLAGTLVFSFYYGNIDQKILDQFTGESQEGEKYILLESGRQDHIELNSSQKGVAFKITQNTSIIRYIVRGQFTCGLQGDVFYAPFEIINLYLKFTAQSLMLLPRLNQNKKIEIKFNCMSSDKVITIQHSENKTFGNYHIASYFLDSKFDKSDKNPFNDQKGLSMSLKEKQKKIKPLQHIKEQNDQSQRKIKKIKKKEKKKAKQFQHIHFKIPMYKYPGVDLIQIFVPLYMLGLINIFIFFQERALSGRIASIATLTLAYIAFIPTINNKITHSPSIKLVEILVYMQALASILCLIQSFLGKDVEEPYDWETDGFFIFCVILNLVNVLIVIILFIIYKFFMQKTYSQPKNDNKTAGEWKKDDCNSLQCDKQFKELIRDGTINILI